jgi:hypothetical protein
MGLSGHFSLEKALAQLKEFGFRWENFHEVFPFGYLDIREGEYYQLVMKVLDHLPSDDQRTLLLDLLDAQWCVFVEQLWIAHELGGDPERFAGENHFALARLQIDSNIRGERHLPPKDGRRAMMSLGENETLLDRIVKSGATST